MSLGTYFTNSQEEVKVCIIKDVHKHSSGFPKTVQVARIVCARIYIGKTIYE